jgi:hypothetical protein
MPFNVCRRIHYGPICVNGEDRATTARIWLQVREIMEKANA